MSTKWTYMDQPSGAMQRKVSCALVTLCLVFFACAILVLTSIAMPAYASESSYNSETIASAGAGSNGVVVMAPAAAPQQAAPASDSTGSASAQRAAALSIPIPAAAPSATPAAPEAVPAAHSGSAGIDEPAATPSAEPAQTDGNPSDPVASEAPTEVYGPVLEPFKSSATDGLPDSGDAIDQIMQDASLDSPLMAASSSIAPQAGNSGFFGSNSNISWNVDTRTMTLTISAVAASGNMAVTEYGAS